MLLSSQGGIQGDDQRRRMVKLNMTDGGFQIFGMNRVFQCAIEMEAIFFQKPALLQTVAQQRTQTVAGSPVGTNAEKDQVVKGCMFF